MDLPFALEGFFFEKVNGSTRQRVTFTFHYIIYAPASRHTLQRRLLLCCWQAAESNSAPFAAVHLNAVCRCTSQLPLRGSFSKRSTGRRVNGSNGSTGQQVTFTFTILYMIVDDAGSRHPAAKSTRRMMTPGSRHTTAKSTQRLLLTRRVNFLVI